MRKIHWVSVLCLVFLLTACTKGTGTAEVSPPLDGDGMYRTYTKISQEDAKMMMLRNDGHVIVDVRRQDEYESGHIPGAVCVPNESITDVKPEALPDPDQVILIYCRSGNRSKQAAEKLLRIGYKNLHEFGGSLDWTGEIVTGREPYGESGKPEPSENAESTETGQTAESEKEHNMIMKIDGTAVPVTWEDNASVEELKTLAAESPLTIPMSMYGGFEQVGPIGKKITRDDRETTTKAGDIVLYSGNQIVVFYGSNSWAYTRLGHVDLSRDEMSALLGKGNVTLTLETE